MSFAGKDGTSDFEETGHSVYAEGLMDKYCIGEIDMATVPLKPIYTHHQPSASHNPTKNKSSEFFIKILQFIAPLLILGLALVVRNYTKEKWAYFFLNYSILIFRMNATNVALFLCLS